MEPTLFLSDDYKKKSTPLTASKTIGIFAETDPLKTAVIWGAVGVEALLAQFYPPEISLFLSDMNVLKVRKEAQGYADKLKSFGVAVFSARDILAHLLKPQSVQKELVHKILVQKAHDIQSQYGTHITIRNYEEIIEVLLEEDIRRYGKDAALTLNWQLSLYPVLPLGNLLYARDQMNVLLTSRVRSAMGKPIRKPEVTLYENVYQYGLGIHNHVITMPATESFEGGDAYIHDKTIYIGVGARTTLGAAICIFEALHRKIEALGYTFAVVQDLKIAKRSPKEQMLYMHLDTFSNPVGKRQIAVYLEEAERRTVRILTKKNHKTEVAETKKSFLDYLMEHDQEIVAIPQKEQQTFGCNFLAINEDHILVPLTTNSKTIDGLKKVGKTVTYVELDESTKGFGAAHCMTGQLLRSQTSP